MKQEVRKSYVARLTREIEENLSGSNFEQFGYIVVDYYFSDYEMMHKGTNIAGAPVGHIVDSVSSDASAVAEYSSDSDYFNTLIKIKKDTRHSFNHYKRTLKKLLLLSNRICPPKMQTKLNRRAGYIEGRLGFQVIIWDARQISEYIVDEILINESDVERLSYFLPFLKQIRNESILNLSLPKRYKNYVSRLDIEQELIAKLKLNQSIVIVGLGGIGKSSLVNHIAHEVKEDFEITIWIDATDLKKLEDLGAWGIHRNGHLINILGVIKIRKCLLILDNISISSAENDFNNICNNNSVIIATRHSIYHQTDYQLSDLDSESAREILEREHGLKCPDNIFKKLYQLIGGYPLIYSLMNANLVNGGYNWNDIEYDCSSIHEYTDDKNRRLTERLLGHLGDSLNNEFAFIKGCGSRYVDNAFAKEYIKPIGLTKLRRFSIVNQASLGILKIHDIVYEAIQHLELPSFDVNSAIKNYLSLVYVSDWSAFLRVSCIHDDLIIKNISIDSHKILQYSYLISHNPHNVDIDLIDPIDTQYNSIISSSHEGNVNVEIMLMLETIEVSYRLRKNICATGRDSAQEAQNELEGRLYIYEDILGLKGLGDDLRKRVKHHQAKSMLWIKKNEMQLKAKDIFVELSDQIVPMCKAQLQLARILIKEEKGNEAKYLIESILNSLNTNNRATVSVYLAAFELITRKPMIEFREELNNSHAETVALFLKETMSFGYDQSYKAFSVFAQNWSFQRPEQFLDVFKSLSLPTVEKLNDDYDKRAIANLYLQAGKIYEYEVIDKGTPLLSLAFEYLNSIKRPSLFDRRRIAEVCCRMGRYTQSETICKTILAESEGKSEPFCLFWLAKSQYFQGYFSDALVNIDEAVVQLERVESNVQYKSAFLEVKSDVLKRLGNDTYLDDLRNAISFCGNEKYKAMLVIKLEGK